MKRSFLINTQTSWLSAFVIIVLFGCMATLPLPWNNTVNNALIDLQFKLRGDRDVSGEIVVVFIGQEDMQELNGWPITRDYYGYATHILHQLGAKTIGFDLLFDTQDSRYPEYDAVLADLLLFAGNVCLPVAFTELTEDNTQNNGRNPFSRSLKTGSNPSFPIEIFRDGAVGIGFSNLSSETIIHKAPLVVTCQDSFILSFGFELALHYMGSSRSSIEINPQSIQISDSTGKHISIPIDDQGQLRLNHFGTLKNLTAISFVDLLQSYQANPDSIDMKGKLVIVAVTSPGIAPLKVTPLAAAFPASFVHATVAENMIEQNFLQELPKLFTWLFIFLLLISLTLIWRFRQRQRIAAGSAGIIVFYWIAAMLAFNLGNYVFPTFYPSCAYFTMLAFLVFTRIHYQRVRDTSQKQLLKAQIEEKQKQIEDAETSIAEAQHQLDVKLAEKQALSEESQRVIEEKKLAITTLEKQLRDLQTCNVSEKPPPNRQFPDLIYSEKSKMVEVLDLVNKIGSDDISVLICGETGTGKEVIARAIHQSGSRQKSPFIAINCSALPETLLESELFGHEKGSFTGAQAQRRGRFELANGGTIFLDEITETTQAFQSKLLRVLQEGTLERLGGEKTIKVNVRIIAAASKNLNSEVEKGSFRVDLFYRLNGFPISIPPLRERKDDIPLLATHFLKKHGYGSISNFSDRAMEVLTAHPFPGNVRELENIVRRAAILAQSETRDLIQIQDLPKEILQVDSGLQHVLYQPLEVQILEMLRSLQFSHSAISQTAKALGNRDRGTITEYFRGMCFENLVNSNFDFDKAAVSIAGTNDDRITQRVRNKIEEYLKNLNVPSDIPDLDETNRSKMRSQFKGLPKKYRPYLEKVLEYYS